MPPLEPLESDLVPLDGEQQLGEWGLDDTDVIEGLRYLLRMLGYSRITEDKFRECLLEFATWLIPTDENDKPY